MLPSSLTRVSLALALTSLAAASACGGAVDLDVSQPRSDAGHGSDATAPPPDASKGGVDSSLHCVLVPVQGDVCSPSEPVCAPTPPCASDTSWVCIDQIWTLVDNPPCLDGTVTGPDSALGDGGVIGNDGSGLGDVTEPSEAGPVDGGRTDVIIIGEDAGADGGIVASCKECAPGTLCVVTTSTGGVCESPGDAGVCPGACGTLGACCAMLPADEAAQCDLVLSDGAAACANVLTQIQGAGLCGGVGSGQVDGGCCSPSTTTFRCEPVPSSCDEGVSCACASAVCDGCACVQPVGDAGATSSLQCLCAFP